MTLREQVYAQAALLAGQMESERADMLSVLCTASTVSLAARLKDGLRPEDCKADFIAAASLFALAALNGVKDGTSLEQISAGDLTIRKGGNSDAASNVLRNQAELMIAYVVPDHCV